VEERHAVQVEVEDLLKRLHLPGPLEIASGGVHQLPRHAVRKRRDGVLVHEVGLDPGLPVRPVEPFLADREALDAAEKNVEPPVLELADVDHPAQTAHPVDRRVPPIPRLPPLSEEDHPDDALPRHAVVHHLAVARLEDVDGEERPGKENDARKGKEGNVVGSRRVRHIDI
jgi:hypothetical protein